MNAVMIHGNIICTTCTFKVMCEIHGISSHEVESPYTMRHMSSRLQAHLFAKADKNQMYIWIRMCCHSLQQVTPFTQPGILFIRIPTFNIDPWPWKVNPSNYHNQCFTKTRATNAVHLESSRSRQKQCRRKRVKIAKAPYFLATLAHMSNNQLHSAPKPNSIN